MGGILHKPWEEAPQEGNDQQGQRLSRAKGNKNCKMPWQLQQ